ncbi:hypothetical protein [Longitalea luteola]|uniref:hypothetical protein n=1 Tax=Longitalea luteola TaxID=2812563 RepID=UPI001A97796C|nr:hypothetical protein [Longitalea luteola]
MSKFKAIREIIGKTIVRVYLVVWPPFGEDRFSQVDLSFGFKFDLEENGITVISTSLQDIWTPTIRIEYPSSVFESKLFYNRMPKWMKSEMEAGFSYEFYDVTDWEVFDKILNHKINKLEWICVGDIKEPLGVRLCFDDDFVLSFPNADGNTVQTSRFNLSGNLRAF